MSSLSFIVRVLLVFVLLAVAYAQTDSSSSSSSSSSSTGAVVARVSSSSSSSPVVPPTNTKPMRVPYILRISGCNSNASMNVSDTTDCDGQSGLSTITITGVNFTSDGFWASFVDSMTVNVACSSNSYPLSVAGSAVYDNRITVASPKIDKSDVDSPCTLSVTHTTTDRSYSGSPATSNSVDIQFSSYAYDWEGAWKLLGMTLTNLIIAVTVVGIVILVIVVLCTLSCCCGVSLAFLNCCRSRPATVILSPQSSGYASMA